MMSDNNFEKLHKTYMQLKHSYLCRSIIEAWDSFDIDDYQDFSEIVEDYTDDLSLDINPDWLLWELELHNV